ncbi:endonuclease domain-containing protein [Candidatus Gracilibacteria bacterium]|nr:endonuclease domain-containing protein [Candidatus Gracilibacteria bacterium]
MPLDGLHTQNNGEDLGDVIDLSKKFSNETDESIVEVNDDIDRVVRSSKKKINPDMKVPRKLRRLSKKSGTLDDYMKRTKAVLKTHGEPSNYADAIGFLPQKYGKKYSEEIFSDFVSFITTELMLGKGKNPFLRLCRVLRDLSSFKNNIVVHKFSSDMFLILAKSQGSFKKHINRGFVDEIMRTYALYGKALEIPLWLFDADENIERTVDNQISDNEEKILNSIRKKYPKAESGRFICGFELDIFIPELMINIEGDGDGHRRGLKPIKDTKRDDVLKQDFGITTLRYATGKGCEDVEKHIQSLLNWIQTISCREPIVN